MYKLKAAVNDLCIQYEGFSDLNQKWTELLKSSVLNEENPEGMDIRDRVEARRQVMRQKNALQLAMTANFLFMFSVFERFMTDLVQENIETDDEVKALYRKQFADMLSTKIKSGDNPKKWNMLLSQILSQEEDILDHYQVLEKGTAAAAVGLCKRLLKIDINSDPLTNYYWKTYLEARERRNLFTHRGNRADPPYFEALELPSALGQKARKWLEQQPYLDPLEEEDPTDLSINQGYLTCVFCALVFLMVYFATHSKTMQAPFKWNKSFKEEESDEDPVYCLKTVALLGTNSFCPDTILGAADSAYMAYLTKRLCSTENDPYMASHPLSIINHFLVLDLMSDKDADTESMHERMRLFLLEAPKQWAECYGMERVAELIPSMELLAAYLKDDMESFIEETRKWKGDSTHFNVNDGEWLIFQKYLRSESFCSSLGIEESGLVTFSNRRTRIKLI